MLELNLAVLCAVVSVVIAGLTYFGSRNKDHDSTARRDAEHSTSVKEELKYISRGIEDIKYDTKTLAGSMNAMNERLIRAEETIKNVEKDIEKLKNN